MGKTKITIQPIAKHRDKQMTFYKRKKGLLKKAIELSVLCETRVFLALYDNLTGRISTFQSHELASLLSLFKTAPPRLFEMFVPSDYTKVTGGEQLGKFAYNFEDAFEGVTAKAKRASKAEERESKAALKERRKAQKGATSHLTLISEMKDLLKTNTHSNIKQESSE